LARCLDAARRFGYATCYLETLARMDTARALYAQYGFKPLSAPMGKTGHYGCDSYYALDLNAQGG
jgi:putative acetyltransferase